MLKGNNRQVSPAYVVIFEPKLKAELYTCIIYMHPANLNGLNLNLPHCTTLCCQHNIRIIYSDSVYLLLVVNLLRSDVSFGEFPVKEFYFII